MFTGHNLSHFACCMILCDLVLRQVHAVIIAGARQAGFDTLQFPGSLPMARDDFTYEIIAVNTRCDAMANIAPRFRRHHDRGACPPNGWLTQGRNNAVRPCECDPSSQAVNCVMNTVGDVDRGQYDETTSHSLTMLAPTCVAWKCTHTYTRTHILFSHAFARTH